MIDMEQDHKGAKMKYVNLYNSSKRPTILLAMLCESQGLLFLSQYLLQQFVSSPTILRIFLIESARIEGTLASLNSDYI